MLAGKGEVTLRFVSVSGNNLHHKHDPHRPGKRDMEPMEITVSQDMPVEALKEELCSLTGIGESLCCCRTPLELFTSFTPCFIDRREATRRRLRFTNWMDEAGDLVEEVKIEKHPRTKEETTVALTLAQVIPPGPWWTSPRHSLRMIAGRADHKREPPIAGGRQSSSEGGCADFRGRLGSSGVGSGGGCKRR